MLFKYQPIFTLMKKLTFLFFILTISACAVAQPKTKPEKSPADKYAEEAYLELMKPDKDIEKALEICNKGVKKDSTSAKIWEYKGGVEYEMKQFNAAIKSYKKVISLEPENYTAYYSLGLAQRMILDFDGCKASLTKYVNAPIKRSKVYEADAKKTLANLDTYKKLLGNKIDFKPINLGPSVNTVDGEYWPGLTLDGKYFYFTRMNIAKSGRPSEDLYRSNVEDTVLSFATRLPEPINTPDEEGTFSLSADGKSIFFSANNRLDNRGIPIGQGRFDLYFSAYRDGQWSPGINLGSVINSPAWESQPSISPDGLTLYFSSTRPGGFGGADIWYSTFKDGRFQPPKNLGPEINTAGEEQSPFIHYDNQTLYFSSTGLPGMGGIDLFVAKKGINDSFSAVQNIGYPLNTEKDELCLVVDRMGKFGYLSSERTGGYGGLDIWKFELPKNLKPDPVSYVQGTVYDAKSLEKMVANIELTDLSTGKIISTIQSQKNGEFFIVLKSNRNYMFTIDQTNYLFYSDNFALKEHPALEPYKLEIALKKPEANIDITLKNVFFDVDKFELKSESKYELDKLVLLLNKFPFMKIEIGGHTDNTGDAKKNTTLSLNRAKAVRDYLVKGGIDFTRLTFVGYGDSKPIADNNTAEGKAKNRRTVFKVMSVK